MLEVVAAADGELTAHPVPGVSLFIRAGDDAGLWHP
jgi:hypothetical protein